MYQRHCPTRTSRRHCRTQSSRHGPLSHQGTSHPTLDILPRGITRLKPSPKPSFLINPNSTSIFSQQRKKISHSRRRSHCRPHGTIVCSIHPFLKVSISPTDPPTSLPFFNNHRKICLTDVHAFLAWFDISFECTHKKVRFSTGPHAQYTHWKYVQCLPSTSSSKSIKNKFPKANGLLHARYPDNQSRRSNSWHSKLRAQWSKPSRPRYRDQI